jgi:hypothetical protein
VLRHLQQEVQMTNNEVWVSKTGRQLYAVAGFWKDKYGVIHMTVAGFSDRGSHYAIHPDATCNARMYPDISEELKRFGVKAPRPLLPNTNLAA